MLRNTATRVSEPIHGFSGRIRSLQRGSKRLSFTGDNDLTITLVDVNHAWANGLSQSNTPFRNPRGSVPYLQAATNVRWKNGVAGANSTYSWEVVEVWP